jgi:hypothetical protein
MIAVILHTLAGIPNGGADAASEHPPAVDCNQRSNNGSEWVELFVREMTNASDIDDARARASRALEAFEKSIIEHAGGEETQNLDKVCMCFSIYFSCLVVFD